MLRLSGACGMSDDTDDTNIITLDDMRPADPNAPPKAKRPRSATGERTNGGRPTRKGKVRRDADTLPGIPKTVIQGATAPTAWGPADLIKACREETMNNVRVLVEMRDDNDVPAAVRACAVSMLFDRAYGRAPQMIAVADVTPKGFVDPANLSDEELLLLERLMRKASGELPAVSSVPTIDHDDA